MKICRLAIIFASLFVASLINPTVAQDREIIREFSRMDYFSGTKLSFVLLNEKTINIFFNGSNKDMIQAKADVGTCFYIMGTADKNMKMSTDFVVEQDGEKFAGTVMNIENFVDGVIPKGEKISGILQLQNKLKLNRHFTVKNAGGRVNFKLSGDALRDINK